MADQQNVIVILGAGASAPYGYPINRNLRKRLLATRQTGYVSNDDKAYYVKEEIERVVEFRNRLACSYSPTIDEFVRSVPDLADVAKVELARILIPFENPRMFFTYNEHDWYAELVQSVHTKIGNGIGSDIKIVTFNYDRSCEYVFFKHFKSINRIPAEAHISDGVRGLVDIHHVYGCFGLESGRFMDGCFGIDGNSWAPERIRAAASSIQWLFEKAGHRDDFDWQGLYRSARKIVILGFGFADANLMAMRSDLLREAAARGVPVLATVVGFAGQQIVDLQDRLGVSVQDRQLWSSDSIANLLKRCPQLFD